MKTLLVIPVYNHGGFLKEVVCKGLATGLPLLVVDDGSTDRGTAELKDLDCHIITIAVNRGKGAAIMAGVRFAADHEFDAIVTFDADGQHDPADAVKLISRAERQWPVIVVGAREMTGATVPKSSLFGRAFSNFWVRLESGMDLPDTQSGYRLYPVRELLRLALKSLRYDFEVEVLVRAAWARVPVDSVPVSVHYPPQG
ncbi:MAG: glycosyltransferase family 2 protein, partial [Desulfobulbaceae bacterium]|nr:glycosyltransferase family 2 protein [Desulfobulbaceae bacterium]